MASSSADFGLASLMADKPAPSAAPPPAAAAAKKAAAIDKLVAQAEKKQAQAKPLSKEATKYAMESMLASGGIEAELEGAHKSDGENAKIYWKIQAYKRAFKDRLQFNTRVTRDSPTAVLQKELESVQNQLAHRNSVSSMKELYIVGGESLGTLLAMYNPTDFNVKGMGKAWHKWVEEDKMMDDEITEMAIKWGDYISQGPEIRSLIKLYQFVRLLDIENRKGKAMLATEQVVVDKHVRHIFDDI